MNIVKLKDIIKPNDEFFNTYLKGKYAWWVHMRYIIPFEKMGIQGYIACEENICDLFKPPFGTEFRDTYEQEMWPYIDQTGTDIANSISLYKMKNKYSPDADITADEVKKFRTWLASELLKFDQDNKGKQMYSLYTTKVTHMLEYYTNNMFDEAIKRLSEFGNSVFISNINTKPCGCGSSDLSSLYNINNSICDPIAIYRRDVYNVMVDTFSDIELWTKLPKEFIIEFKKYIDNIINMNLVLGISDYVNSFADCTCNGYDNSNNINILKKLSTSLSYIIDDKTAGHKNFIGDSFNEWAAKLYELMQW